MELTYADRQRLETLRDSDTTGMYAASGPASATDSSGALTVTVDELNRIEQVVVHHLSEEQRDASRLVTTLEDAIRAVVLSKLPEPTPEKRRFPVAVKPVSPGPMEFGRATKAGRRPDRYAREEAPRGLTRSLGPYTGVSENQCVTVTVLVGTPFQSIEVDPGWLRQASPRAVSNSLTEAFTAAYEKRDH